MTVIIIIIFALFCLLGAILANHLYGKVGVVATYIFFIIMTQLLINVQVQLFGMTIVVGSIVFAVLSVCVDIANEFYGRKEADKMVNIGGIILIILFISLYIIKFFPLIDNEYTQAFRNLFSNQNRIIISDLIFSYYIFQKVDVFIFDFLRKKTKGKHLWLRAGGSTMISQTLIAFAFYQAAFWGVWPQSTILSVIISGLVIKYIVSALQIPIIYLSKKFYYKYQPKTRAQSRETEK